MIVVNISNYDNLSAEEINIVNFYVSASLIKKKRKVHLQQ